MFEGFKDVRYRIRVFDQGNFLMSAEVPNKGQRYVTLTVHAELFGIGEKTKLAFMINPDIKPKMFNGKIMEIDFDIRDTTQLADLLDLAPNLVYEINTRYRNYKGREKENEERILNAEFDIKDALSDNPKPETDIPKPLDDEEEEDARAIDTLVKGIENAGDILPHLPVIGKFKTVPENKKEENIQKCLDLCQQHPKLLYWLPKYIKIEPEIHAIVSQSRIYRTGIQPSYYHAQTGAMIAEKVLARPKEQTGWQQVALYAIIIIAILGTIGIIAWLLKG